MARRGFVKDSRLLILIPVLSKGGGEMIRIAHPARQDARWNHIGPFGLAAGAREEVGAPPSSL